MKKKRGRNKKKKEEELFQKSNQLKQAFWGKKGKTL